MTDIFYDLGSESSNSASSSPDDDVVDGDVNELDEEANESHDAETDGRRQRDLGKLLTIRLGTSEREG